MIDPFKPQNFNATTDELEEILLFCVVVAGKTATTQTKLLDEFLNQPWLRQGASEPNSPFSKIYYLVKNGLLFNEVKKSRLGQYTRISQTFYELVHSGLDLETCTVADLEAITGIGPKTARFFMLCTRPNIEVAALDTHILKFLADKGHKVPKATPPRGELYNRLEKLFLAYATIAEKSPQEFDLEVWTKYTKTTPLKTERKRL